MTPDDGSTEEKNRQLIRRSYAEVLMNKDTGAAMRVVDEIFAPDYKDHTLFDVPQMAPDLEALKGLIQVMLGAFSDIDARINILMADGEHVAHYSSFHARHTGEFFGIPATGKELRWNEVHMSRVRDGRVVEHWGHIDTAAIMKQLGVTPGAS